MGRGLSVVSALTTVTPSFPYQTFLPEQKIPPVKSRKEQPPESFFKGPPPETLQKQKVNHRRNLSLAHPNRVNYLVPFFQISVEGRGQPNLMRIAIITMDIEGIIHSMANILPSAQLGWAAPRPLHRGYSHSLKGPLYDPHFHRRKARRSVHWYVPPTCSYSCLNLLMPSWGMSLTPNLLLTPFAQEYRVILVSSI